VDLTEARVKHTASENGPVSKNICVLDPPRQKSAHFLFRRIIFLKIVGNSFTSRCSKSRKKKLENLFISCHKTGFLALQIELSKTTSFDLIAKLNFLLIVQVFIKLHF